MTKNGTWIRILVVVGIALLTFATGWGMLRTDVKHNTKTIEKHEVKIDKLEDAVIKQTTHYEHIVGTLEEIKDKLP